MSPGQRVSRELLKLAVRQSTCSRPVAQAVRFSHTSTKTPISTRNWPPRWRQPLRSRTPAAMTLLASGGLLSLFFVLSEPSTSSTHDDIAGAPGQAPPSTDDRDPKLPRFRLSDVKKHDAKSGTPWVTRDDKVYDITEWVAAHPGGEVILRAAGGSIDPYWDIFTIHKVPYVAEILAQYMIGYIDSADLVNGKPAAEEIEDPFQDDPKRDARLITRIPKPQNAETPTDGLVESFLTPNELFYVRNHMWVPKLDDDGEEHTLTIELLDGSTKEYTLRDLKEKFKPCKITATLQCSGNRRKDMTTHAKKTNGIQWNVGAISCAEWEGVRLIDILADAGFPIRKALEGDTEARHVQFSGLETYGASIPLNTALDPLGDVILAYTMNGKPLPRDHGFPLRALVPGHVAARSVKWLSHITISDEESHSQWQRRDYKCFGPNETNPDWDKAPAIQEMPITSAITSVKLGGWSPLSAEIDNDGGAKKEPAKEGSRASVQGYAYSGGGRKIVRVDISLDNGQTWDQADLLEDAPAPDSGKESQHTGHKSWAWTRWRYEGTIPLTEADDGNKKCSTLLVKATDEAYNSQPESHKAIYNVRGNLANAWHRLRVCSDCEQNNKAD